MGPDRPGTSVSDVHGTIDVSIVLGQKIRNQTKKPMLQPARRRHASGDSSVEGLTVQSDKGVGDRWLGEIWQARHDHSRIEAAGQGNPNAGVAAKVARKRPSET